MGAFANRRWVKVLAWTAAAIIIVLNANLVVTTISGWIGVGGRPGALWPGSPWCPAPRGLRFS